MLIDMYSEIINVNKRLLCLNKPSLGCRNRWNKGTDTLTNVHNKIHLFYFQFVYCSVIKRYIQIHPPVREI